MIGDSARQTNSFTAHDGTELAYSANGSGSTVICLPGGPMQDSAYFGDLGGLASSCRTVMLDLRGTGRSATPDDASSYRCDRLVGDVQALRVHLGLDQVDLLAHSAGANLAVLYAQAHQERVRRMALITPSTRAVGIDISAEMRLATARLRAGEPWYPAAIAALELTTSGGGGADEWAAITPLTYGRWDAAAQAHNAAESGQQNQEAAMAFGAEGAFTPDDTRARLADVTAPVLLLAGELDVAAPPAAMAEFAGLFAAARLVVQPGAGHYPWLDDGDRFVSVVAPFFA